MRCPDCNKFTGLEFQDPQVESLEVEATDEHTIVVTASVSLERNCAECGQTMKTATLEMEETVEIDPESLEEAVKDLTKVDLDISEGNCEQVEEGGGRYAKSYFGATIDYVVTAEGVEIHAGSLTDKVAASEMEEAV